MDVREWFNERIRMCSSRNSTCAGCIFDDGYDCVVEAVRVMGVDNVADYVENWSKEHPVKTNLDYFKECFPKLTKSDEELAFDYCADYLGLNHLEYDCDVCTGDCIECWNLPYEEDKK